MADETNPTAPGPPSNKPPRRADHVSVAAAERCDVCGAEMRPMGHCKYWCLRCGYLMTCHDRF